jgi:hypothetical protein
LPQGFAPTFGRRRAIRGQEWRRKARQHFKSTYRGTLGWSSCGRCQILVPTDAGDVSLILDRRLRQEYPFCRSPYYRRRPCQFAGFDFLLKEQALPSLRGHRLEAFFVLQARHIRALSVPHQQHFGCGFIGLLSARQMVPCPFGFRVQVTYDWVIVES